MLSVAPAILMAIKPQTLKQHQPSTPYQKGMVKSQLRWGGHKGSLAPGYLTTERKEILKSILI